MRALWLAGLLVALAPGVFASDGPVIHLRNGSFEPDAIHVDARESTIFVNDDDRAHTVTSAWDGGRAFNVVLAPGRSVPIEFEQPGSYPIRCMPHSTQDASGMQGMVATIHVDAAGGARSSSVWSIGGVLALGFLAVGALRLSGARARRRPRSTG